MKILAVLCFPFVLMAHSLSATASYEDNELFIESFFGDGSACKSCPFTIKQKEQVIYSGKLDENGGFEEKVSLKPPFEVHIDGGMGHHADVQIDGTEFIKEEVKEKKQIQEVVTSTTVGISEEKIREIIRSELKKQNSKIESIVEKNRSNLEKMLVGLGYILGLFGLWQLFARPKQK